MKTVVIASNNDKKAREIAESLDFSGWEFRTLKQLSIDSDPSEDSDTFVGNALIKARAAHRQSGGLAVLADDSGLEVDVLSGAPGVFSARYAGENAQDCDNNAKLLVSLEGVSQENRSARFVCVLVFIDEDGTELIARGIVEGSIGFSLRGEHGFGYDPLFVPDLFIDGRTLAEATFEEKNLISHRGNALSQLKDMLALRIG